MRDARGGRGRRGRGTGGGGGAGGSPFGSESPYTFVGRAAGLAAGLGTLLVERVLRRVQGRVLISGLVGLVIGLLLARFLLDSVAIFLEPSPQAVRISVALLVMVAAGDIATAVAVEKGRGLSGPDLAPGVKGQPGGGRNKIPAT